MLLGATGNIRLIQAHSKPMLITASPHEMPYRQITAICYNVGGSYTNDRYTAVGSMYASKKKHGDVACVVKLSVSKLMLCLYVCSTSSRQEGRSL